MMVRLFVLFVLVSAPAAVHASSAKAVYQKAAPGVVLILGADGNKGGSGGTGSFITSSGHILTNAHVVINASGKPYKKLYVYLKPKRITGDNKVDLARRYSASVVAFSPAEDLDLALLKLSRQPNNVPIIYLAESAKVEIGDDVFAIGHPEQGGLFTLTTGVISTNIANFGRVRGKHVFQTNASVNRGNSGGPLLNDRGEMVGINTAIARVGAGGIPITDVNFSLKTSVARKWLLTQGIALPTKLSAPSKSSTGLAKVVSKAPVAPVAPVAPIAPTALEPKVAVQAPTTPKAPVAKEIEIVVPAVVVSAPTELAPPAALEVAKAVAEETKRVKTKVAVEKVLGGKRQNLKKAKPVYVTKKRPFNIDDLRKKEIRVLENLMDEMRGKLKK